MIEVIKWGKILIAILKDKKITKEELPEFMEALAGLTMALVAVILPLLRVSSGKLAKRFSGGVSVAANELRR